MSRRPTGTVTLLFTDIEGSTRTWEEQPDAMRSALRQHDDLLARRIAARGGYVFKTVGDAFCAAFSDAGAALDATAEAQRALAFEPWPPGAALKVRMALHSGACDERDGDYFGPSVNRVARLLSLGHGGQVLVSAATAVLAGDRLPAGTALRELGEYPLKDLDQPVRVSQLVVDGLPSDFPPLRSAAAVERHNLPEQLTSFVGRERELDELRALLGDARIVTLVGPGGAGKTRLVLEAARADLQAREQVWLVELAPVADEREVPAAIASALKIREQPERSTLEAVTGVLAVRDALIVIDNCEHVLTGAARAVDAIARSCPKVAVLATSREPLALPGEHVMRLGAVSEEDAVALFVDRVRLHDPRFELDGQPVAEICRRLDDMPLAIELAAARTRTMSIAELNARLDDRFRVVAGSRGADRRQQTLRATLDWSFELLSVAEQVLFARFSVFAGGFDLAAAEAVCGYGEVEREDVWELTASLVDKSLVVVDPDHSDRYGLLETMRAYARERLGAGGDGAAGELRRRHLEHYADVAEGVGPLVRGRGGREAIRVLELERENMRVALRTALDDALVDAGLRLAAGLSDYWPTRSLDLEAAEWLAPLLDHPRAERGTLRRGQASYGLGFVLKRLADFDAASARVAEAEAIAVNLDDLPLAVRALSTRAVIAVLRRETGSAFELAVAAVAHAKRSGDPALLASALSRQADAYDVAGDLERTRALLDEALALARGRDDEMLLGSLLNNAGEAAYWFRDYVTARSRFEECIALAEPRADDYLLSYAKRNLAGVLVDLGDLAGAGVAIADALGLAERGGPVIRGYCLMVSARLASVLGDREGAATLLGATDALFESIATAPENVEQRARDELEDDLRAALDAPAFAEAYARGRTLPRGAALALAYESAREAAAVGRSAPD